MATLGSPIPDRSARKSASSQRREELAALADARGAAVTPVNGEEIAQAGFAFNYHKGLPHDVNGFVHKESYGDMVAALVTNAPGALEKLPMGGNRSIPASGAGTPTNPERHTERIPGSSEPLSFRKLTSPLTGHVYDTQGADAGAFGFGAVPFVASPEFAAEMAELYAMALLRDEPFTEIHGGGASATAIATSLGGMEFFRSGSTYSDVSTRRRYDTRGAITGPADLFRGSTPGSKVGHWLSQFLLVGSDTRGADFEGNSPSDTPSFRKVFGDVKHVHGFVYMGTQIVDQRNVVAKEGVDYLTTWASWLDAQNGVNFGGLDTMARFRRYLTTPRDVATYVHFDALYQAYHMACLLMLGPTFPGNAFPKDRGLPESTSRTRSAFASFGGPHILSLVTEVATRALKAVWRQKWMYHRRMRPEVAAGLITLHANNPGAIPEQSLRDAIGNLAAQIPASILADIATHNAGQDNNGKIADLPGTGLPTIAADKNYLLPMAFPEGSPTHPAYGAGHATVAGACVTTLKAFFEMFDDDGKEREWPLQLYVPDYKPGTGAAGNEDEGGELVPLADADIHVPPSVGSPANDAERRAFVTIQGELDKLAMNIANARNMGGVHYYTDYYESVRLGERIAVSIIEEHLSLYDEPVSMSFNSFDGDLIRIVGNGGTARVSVDGSNAADWYARFGS